MTLTTSAFLLQKQEMPQEDPFDPGVSRKLVHQRVRAAGRVWVSGGPPPPDRRPGEPLIVWQGAGDLDVEADTVTLVGHLAGPGRDVRIVCRVLEIRQDVVIDCTAEDAPADNTAGALAAARARAGGRRSSVPEPGGAARAARALQFDANPRGHLARQRLPRAATLYMVGPAQFTSCQRQAA